MVTVNKIFRSLEIPFIWRLLRSIFISGHVVKTNKHSSRESTSFGDFIRIYYCLVLRQYSYTLDSIHIPTVITATRDASLIGKLLVLTMLMAGFNSAHAAVIRLSVQPDRPVANESFQLVFTSDSKVSAEPDFGVLESFVDILGRNRQTSVQWVNGRNSHTTTWVLEALVTEPGQLVIPEIAFGNDRSTKTTINIHARNSNNPEITDTSLLLEIEVDKTTPYVQEQIILTARLLRRVELNDANLTEPSADTDVVIKRLGKDITTQTMRNNKRYEVFERRFSIFPQTSGTTTINPLTLTKQVVQSSRSLFEFDPFRQSVKTRRVESNQLQIQVKPIPASFTGDTWLPAKQLNLRDNWDPAIDPLIAGEPVTRTVFLWADGLSASQLPELPIVLPEGLKIYPDQPQTSEQDTDTGFNAIRQQKFAIIPGSTSNIVFPEISITWWNTQSDKMEVARLKERPFTVEDSSAEEISAQKTAIPDSASLESQTETEHTPKTNFTLSNTRQNTWLIIASICLFGWIATAFGWYRSYASKSSVTTTRARGEPAPALMRARRDVLGACKAHDPIGTKTALITWARVVFKNPQLSTLRELAELVREPLDIEIRLLDKYLYGQNPTQWDRFALQEAFEHGDYRLDQVMTTERNINPLPDLYHLSKN